MDFPLENNYNIFSEYAVLTAREVMPFVSASCFKDGSDVIPWLES